MPTGNATRWYTTREAVKAAADVSGTERDPVIDANIEAGSEDVEEFLGRAFIPETTERLYRWPPRIGGGTVLRIPREDLIAITRLQTKAQDTSPTTISASDYFVEPVNEGPPFSRIEIDLSSSAAFEGGDTSQRSIGVTGRWGFREDTVAAGALAEADDGTELELEVTDSSLIGVGDTILIGTEALFVSAKALLDTTADLNDNSVTANKNNVSVTLDDATKVNEGEVLTLDSERMLVESISGNVLTVQRAHDGSVLAAHNSGINVFAPRTLTVVRTVNGTSAATHANTTAITKYAPPADIRGYVQAYAISNQHQDATKRTGVTGGDQGSVETKGFSVWALKQALIEKYGVVSF